MTSLRGYNYKSTFLSRENLRPGYDRGEIWNRDTYNISGYNGIVFQSPAVDQQSSALDYLFWNYPSGLLHAWVWDCIVNCYRLFNAGLNGCITETEINHYPRCKRYFIASIANQNWNNLPCYSFQRMEWTE